MTTGLAVTTSLLAGFFGSSHCLGMCGAIVVLLEGGGVRRDSGSATPGVWLRRISYNVGRGTFYALLGGIAGLSGAILTQAAGLEAGLLLLRVVAAILVVAIGLNLLFDWQLTRFLETAGAGLWRKMSRLARHVLPADTAPRALAAGFVWGALPCGLVYSAVAIATVTGDAWSGIATMLAFWLGTLPTLLLAGTSAKVLQRLKSRKLLRRIAGILVILVGLAALAPLHNNSSGHEQHATNACLTPAETPLPC